jgi:hypothetical protein
VKKKQGRGFWQVSTWVLLAFKIDNELEGRFGSKLRGFDSFCNIIANIALGSLCRDYIILGHEK